MVGGQMMIRRDRGQYAQSREFCIKTGLLLCKLVLSKHGTSVHRSKDPML